MCDTDWPVLSYNIEVMRLMRVFVTNRPVTLSPKDWDIILCRTVSMVQVGHGIDEILYSGLLLLEKFWDNGCYTVHEFCH